MSYEQMFLLNAFTFCFLMFSYCKRYTNTYLKSNKIRLKETAQKLGALTVLSEKPDLIPSAYMILTMSCSR